MKDPNKNRPGYKKTKVGWIPNEWDCLHLKDVCEGPGGKYGACASSTEYSQESPRYIRITDISNDGSLVEHGKTSIAPELAEKYLLNPGDFLFARTGATVGKTYLHERNIGHYAFAGYLIRFIPDKISLIGKFLKAYTHTERYYYWIHSILHAGAQPNINAREYGSLSVPIPALPEQKNIAEILSTWDKAIEQTRKLIDAKKSRKKALMQQLLTGKKRLPGFAKSHRYESYRFFELPIDWECTQIRDIATESSERNKNREDITVFACSKHRGFVKSSEYFGKRIFSQDTSNYKIIRRDWFGFPANHVEEGSIGLLQCHDIGIVSPIYIVFNVSDCVIPEYLYAVLKTDTFRHIFAISTNASVDRRGSLRWREFSLIRVPLPSLPEQQAITKVLSAADDEIIQEEHKLKAMKKQKRGLMQKLLTGTIRVLN